LSVENDSENASPWSDLEDCHFYMEKGSFNKNKKIHCFMPITSKIIKMSQQQMENILISSVIIQTTFPIWVCIENNNWYYTCPL